ncbi:MAG: proton-conducting transporter membrane subunit, partial [Sphingomicrobium sp.]
VILNMRDMDGRAVESIASLGGLSRSRKGLAAALAIFMFSLAGIPPLFGFWPKLLVFTAAVDAGLIAVAVIGILGTVVGAYYYLKIVKIMYFDDAGTTLAKVAAPIERVLIGVAALAVSPLGYLLIGPLGALTDRAAGSIF